MASSVCVLSLTQLARADPTDKPAAKATKKKANRIGPRIGTSYEPPMLLQTAFAFQFLLGALENALIDDAVEGHLFVDETGANILVEHELDAVGRDRQVRGVCGLIEIVGPAHDVRIAFEPGGVAGFERLFLARTDKTQPLDERF